MIQEDDPRIGMNGQEFSVDFQTYEELPLMVSILMNADEKSLPEIFEILEEKFFWNDIAKQIYSACNNLYLENKEIEIANVYPRTKLNASRLVELVNEHSNFLPTNSIDAAKKIKEGYYKREIYKFADQTQKDYSNKDFHDLALGLEMKTDELLKVFKTKDGVSIIELIDKLEKEIEKNKDSGIIGYKTGFKKLDKATDGIIVPHIWMIGGYTGTGKTYFVLSMLEGLLKNGIKPVIFSTENSAIRNILRMIGCMTGIPEMTLLKGRIENDNMIVRIVEAKNRLKENNLFVYDDVFDTRKIKALAKKHKKDNGSNLIIVDYIQGLNPGEGDIYKQMSKTAMDLQRISIDLNMAVIGVSQISNTEAMKNSDELMTFKGAGEITAMVIDFEADKMVTVTGSGKIIVKPVVKLTVRQEKPKAQKGAAKPQKETESRKEKQGRE